MQRILNSRLNIETTAVPDPPYAAENPLNRDFHAPKPTVKWLTDITELKWYKDYLASQDLDEKIKRPPGSSIDQNRAAKNGRAYPLNFLNNLPIF